MEATVKHVTLILAAALATSACTPAMYGQHPRYSHYRNPPYEAPPPPPVGRWDNVMMLATGTTVRVLTADGVVTQGRTVAATITTLRVQAGAAETEIPASSVVRVDRVNGPTPDVVPDAARGAAYGAGAVGVLGLIAGRMPPPRVFLAGAIVGAAAGVPPHEMPAGPGTIYLAPHTTQASAVKQAEQR